MQKIFRLIAAASVLVLAGCGGSGGGGSGAVGSGQPPVSGPRSTLELLAGVAGGSGNADGQRLAARFNGPTAVATDRAGNVYVADTNNFTVRRIDALGIVTTLAGAAGQSGTADGAGSSARFQRPTAVAVDAAGNVFVVDGQRIRKVTPAGEATTFAGTTSAGSADGVGEEARFSDPVALATDGAGNVYVADRGNNLVRKITPDRRVTVLARGVGNAVSPAPNPPQINSPSAIASAADGTLYVASGNRINKVSPAGTVTYFAGFAVDPFGAFAPEVMTFFNRIASLAIDAAGGLVVLESTGSDAAKLYRISNRTVTTVATAASPEQAVSTDMLGNFFLVRDGQDVIDAIRPGGTVETFAGSSGAIGHQDGVGENARFMGLTNPAADVTGVLYALDAHHWLRRITPEGAASTVLEWTNGAGNTTYPLNSLAIDAPGNVYLATQACTSGIVIGGPPYPICSDTGVRKVSSGVTSLLGSTVFSAALAMDAAGNLLAADGFSLLRAAPGAAFTKVADLGRTADTLAVDAAGTVYGFFETGIFKLVPGGTPTILVTAPVGARFAGGTVDSAGRVFVADYARHAVFEVSPSGELKAIVGVPGVQGFAPGSLPGALDHPTGVLAAGSNLYITMPTSVAVVRNRP
jgi:hypothetical protein